MIWIVQVIYRAWDQLCSTLSHLLGCSMHSCRAGASGEKDSDSTVGWLPWWAQTHTLTVLCPPCWHLQLAGDKELGGLQAQDSVDSAGGEDGQDDSEVAHQLPHLQMERAWPRLAGVGAAPGAPWDAAPRAIPTAVGQVAVSLGWLKGAHRHREVAAAPEAPECDAEEGGAPEEQEGDEGDIGDILAAGSQEMPTSIQALGPAQPCRGGRRLQGQGGQ